MDQHIDKFEQEGLDMDHAEVEEVLEDVAYYRTLFANVCMIGKPYSDNWVLIGTGVEKYSKRVIAAVEKRFGDRPPKAILLTHGHFEQSGGAKNLAKEWDVPIYVHPNELPYLIKEKEYPLTDPTIGGGLKTLISTFFPKEAIDLRKWAKTLPADGTIPFLEDWKYIHTPGHTPGHISLYREKDKTLIAGDAIATTKAESALATFLHIQKVNGPPAYFTDDWVKAEESVKKLAELEPEVVIASHGIPMEGDAMREQLRDLANNFREQAIPKNKNN